MTQCTVSYIRGAIAAAISGVILCATAIPAPAQDLSDMSCYELWYQRNKIYARNGYCFKTARARAEFGAGCFPPYGELRGWEKRRVSEIQMWESRNGCD